MNIPKRIRSKKFMSTDSLWYEEERLNTFIDWPVKFILPEELAANGFYYLRTKDHCACAFCLGIIGAWEEGDSIIGEHRRHFPDCPLINGQATPNIPLIHGNIIAKLNMNNAKFSQEQNKIFAENGEDVCGTGKEDNQKRHIGMGGDESASVPLSSLGLPMYSGPKKKEYLTYESRICTYKDWPDKVAVMPQDLADAGFFYIGLSDHVRCFHCGNGLRNWEPNDNAWEEHARWYPDCHFVLIKKGTEFIDKIKRTNPPYIHTPPNQPSVFYSKGAKYNKFVITDEELSRLMDLQVIKAISDLGFPQNAIKAALKKKLEQTGVPFFKMEHCIEAVLLVSEEEKQAIEDESRVHQAKKIAMYENGNPIDCELNDNSEQIEIIPESVSEQITSLPVLPSREHNRAIESQESLIIPEQPSEMLETLPIFEQPPPSEMFPILPSQENELVSAESQADPNEISEGSPYLAQPGSSEMQEGSFCAEQPGPSEIQENSFTSPSSSVQSEPTENIFVTAEIHTRSINTSDSDESDLESVDNCRQTIIINNDKPSLQFQTGKDHLLAEADEIIKAAKILLRKDSLSSSRGSSLDTIGDSEEVSGQNSDNAVTTDDLSKELERIKDGRTCRVCMDTEMEVVFLPCTHMTACSSCAVTLSNCPICRGNIQYVIKPIIS